jgi:hypothetical protein
MKAMLDSILLGLFGLGGSEMIILILVLGIIPLILFLVTLQTTLNEISIENQKIPPGQVWLILIPLFGIVWQFIVINRTADSLKAEFAKRNTPVDEDRPGISIGLTYCILNCCAVVPVLGIFAAVAGLVCWIIYWTKISGYKTKLQQSSSPYIN